MTEQNRPPEENRPEDATPPETPPPPPPMQPAARTPGNVESETRTWAMVTHLAALVGFVIPIPFASVLGPLFVWQIKKNELPDLDPHGKAAVNFQITAAIAAVVSFILVFVFIGILMLMALGIFVLVEMILNAIRANNGEPPRYHLSLTLIR